MGVAAFRLRFASTLRARPRSFLSPEVLSVCSASGAEFVASCGRAVENGLSSGAKVASIGEVASMAFGPSAIRDMFVS
jgi:hypothetical protein